MKRKFDRDEQTGKTYRRAAHRKSRFRKHIKPQRSGIFKTWLTCGAYRKIAPAALSLLLTAALITSAVLSAADADGAENAVIDIETDTSGESAESADSTDNTDSSSGEDSLSTSAGSADTASSGNSDVDTAGESDGGGSRGDIRHGHRI